MDWHSYLFLVYSWVSVLLWTGVICYRYLYQVNYAEVYAKDSPVSDKLDIYILLLVFPFGIYYVIDSVFILSFLPTISACNWSYLSHHIVAIFAVPYVITMPHYPWFILLPYGWHSLLLMFPTVKIFKFIYVCLILLKIWSLHQLPWAASQHYRVYRAVCYAMLTGPLVMLWYNQCTNMANVDL